MSEPCVHAPLLSELVTFLDLTRLPLPLGLFDSCGMNDTWAFRLLFFASHPFFELGIAWVWAFPIVLGPCFFTLRPWVG